MRQTSTHAEYLRWPSIAAREVRRWLFSCLASQTDRFGYPPWESQMTVSAMFQQTSWSPNPPVTLPHPMEESPFSSHESCRQALTCTILSGAGWWGWRVGGKGWGMGWGLGTPLSSFLPCCCWRWLWAQSRLLCLENQAGVSQLSSACFLCSQLHDSHPRRGSRLDQWSCGESRKGV